MMHFKDLKESIYYFRKKLIDNNNIIETNQWQGLNEGFEFLELQNVHFDVPLSSNLKELNDFCNPLQPWSDIHFEERVGGVPLNPPESHKLWLKGNEKFMSGDKFSHSYPERMWSKGLHSGIRFEIGDLNDALDLLKKDITTRQCYIPIWFPEDLKAANMGERVPCTFGWHIMVRNKRLSIHYPMRSCDAIRHFHNDLYLANRLALWFIEKLDCDLKVGNLMFSCSSFHCFKNDRIMIKNILGIND